MATKKPSVAKPKSKSEPARSEPARAPSSRQPAQGPRGASRLQNLAAKPVTFDDTMDEQLVDNSGVFRVTTAIAREQIGHDDDNNPRFASDSLVMAAQRDGFREEGPTLDEEVVVEAEVVSAAKRQRLATLAARAARQQPRRR
jgi:hypothetical protein